MVLYSLSILAGKRARPRVYVPSPAAVEQVACLFRDRQPHILQRQVSSTPDSVLSVICLTALRWRRLPCRVLLGFGIVAATGSNRARALAAPTRLAPSWTFTQPPPSPTTLAGFYPAVSPITWSFVVQSNSRVVGYTTIDPVTSRPGRSALCCSCRQSHLTSPDQGEEWKDRPHLPFREATASHAGDRESGSSSHPKMSDGPLLAAIRVRRQGIEP